MRYIIIAAFLAAIVFYAFFVNEAKAEGLASYYWQGQNVACGGKFNKHAMTAAHRTLPCGTRVKVTNKLNGRSVVVTINDRGPFVAGRVIDVSIAAAQQLGMTGRGLVPVNVTVQ